MGVFVKNQELICWDFWNNINSRNNFNDISFYIGKENIHNRFLMVVSHHHKERKFSVTLKSIDGDIVASTQGETNESMVFHSELIYDGDLIDYTDTPYNYGIANFEHDLPEEHKAICEYKLFRTGLFTSIYSDKEIFNFLDINEKCKRTLKHTIPNSMFLINTNELTNYKAYDNSGNCYNLEINVGLIKKIFNYHEDETINLQHINKEKEII